MKNIFKYLATMAMCVALTGLVACDPEPDPEPTPDTYTESATYGIIYDDAHVAAGEILTIHPTLGEIDNDFVSIELLPENKTDNSLETKMKVELLEGPDVMKDIMICYGETCKNPTCPWTSDAFTLEPGVNYNMLVKFDYAPSKVTSKTTYRLTLGKGASLDDPQVILINVNAQ